MRPFISILIPAYQAQNTIRRCLNSVLNQTIDDFEVILINDGSKDETLSICHEFSAFECLKVISQDNVGIAATRNKLLEYATGEYIQFVDADDWIENDTVERLKACINTRKYDMIISDFIAEYVNSSKYILQQPSGVDCASLVKDISSSRMLGALWNKLIKRELLNDIVVPDLRYCEDWVVSVHLFEKVKSVLYLNDAFYHYDNSFIGNSLTRNISKDTFNSRIEYIEHLKSLNFNDRYPIEFASQVSSIAYTAVIHEIYTKKDFNQMFGEVSFIKNYISSYKKLILMISRIFSIPFASFIDGIVRKMLNKQSISK